MKTFLILSTLLLSTVLADWPTVSWVDPATGGIESEYDSSDPADQYPDSDASDSLDICWKQSYARYGHSLVNSCAEGLVKIGAYCYEPCKAGYESGYFSGLASETEQDPEQSEDTSDVESYCWSKCPKGYEDYETNSCYKGEESIPKKSYNRTYVDALDCPTGLEFDNGKCYTPAEKDFTCQGALCLGKCPHGWGECGVLCAKIGKCTGDVMNEGFDVSYSLGSMASELKHPSQGHLVNATAVPGVLNGTIYPFCH